MEKCQLGTQIMGRNSVDNMSRGKVCLQESMAGFQDANWASLIPYCNSMAEQLSFGTTRWKLLQLVARPG
jgi:hypothetical protein